MPVSRVGGRSPAPIGSQRSANETGQFGAAGPPATTVVAELATVAQGGEDSHRGQGGIPGRIFSVGSRWPLLEGLAAQAVLSLRLIWSNTAFQDEALYLRAGHLEWARWLHHAPIPNFPAYFSGAPVIYPPLGALADDVGGLVAARILSLCFMLGVTSLLWATTGRLYGQRAALLAAALFATLAGTQFLGAVATFDALALFLLALAVWLGVRSAGAAPRAALALLAAAGVTLTVAAAGARPVLADGRPGGGGLLARADLRGRPRRRPGLLAGHHDQHPGPAAGGLRRHDRAPAGLR